MIKQQNPSAGCRRVRFFPERICGFCQKAHCSQRGLLGRDAAGSKPVSLHRLQIWGFHKNLRYRLYKVLKRRHSLDFAPARKYHKKSKG